jgi:hypothetical protein
MGTWGERKRASKAKFLLHPFFQQSKRERESRRIVNLNLIDGGLGPYWVVYNGNLESRPYYCMVQGTPQRRDK